MRLFKKFDIVKKVNGEDVLYLRRYFIFRSRWFNVYLHNIVRPDEDPDPHDHPWDFVSVVLRGGYTESIHKMMTTAQGYRRIFRWNNIRGLGIRGRLADTVHQIVWVKPNTWTLVFTGPVRRDWGFVKKDGWVFWRTYLNVWTEIEMD